MLRKTILCIISLIPVFLQGQQKNPVIKGSAPSFYLEHTVGAKENYYSIGRLYNSSPSQQIAPFNNLKMEDGLKIGQAIRIPLNETNFTQDGSAAADEMLIPVQHIAGDKETLWGISTRYNKVSVSSIKKWSRVEKEQVVPGTRLTIGFLKVKKDQSTLASLAVAPGSVKAVSDVKNDPFVSQHTESGKNSVMPEESSGKVASPEKNAGNPVKALPEKERGKSDNIVNKPMDDSPGKVSGSGYFKNAFEKQEYSKENRSGSAGVFKSTSGWDDGKFYCLYNEATPGTIVKITNTANKKFVYAKVLDAIPDMKQNEGLIIRLSNAAANELEASGNSFDCSVSY